jgi:O-antigen/teichoic acid export membrane protein
MRDKDYKEIMSKIWRILATISFISWSLIYPFNELIFNLLFEGDYVNGSQVFPYLFLSPLLQMLYSVISTQFLVSKKTYWSTAILFLGALVNVFLNFVLIPLLGIRGAAISTMVGYSISVVLAGIVVAAKRQMIFQKKTLLNVLAFAFLILLNIWNESNFLINCLTSSIFVIITLLISWTDISELISRLLRKGTNLEVNK